MLFDVGLHRIFGVFPGKDHVASRCVSMVCSHSVFSRIVCQAGTGSVKMSRLLDNFQIARHTWFAVIWCIPKTKIETSLCTRQ
jgi:hypothetical protein